MPQRPATRHRQQAQGATGPMVSELLQYVTDADDARRRLALAGVLPVAPWPVLRLVVDRLVAALGGRGARAPQAAASLRDLGAFAIPSLLRALLRGRRQSARLRLVDLLTEIGRCQVPADRVDLLLALCQVGSATRDVEVRQACARALIVVGRAGREDGERPGTAAETMGDVPATPAGTEEEADEGQADALLRRAAEGGPDRAAPGR
jgi:hypothetical protein